MKKLAALGAIMLLAASFNTSAYLLAGEQVEIPKRAIQECATAESFFDCVKNYQERTKK
ncbi:hypothetical protein [Photobacterium sp. J15]|uniref:hypothetical protein n=1 Tax=Photobacterium sp. J15 TaxID=265901 RepID=UPI000AD68F38|nr:hypothetical protein [Photobacterium sp. J15]